MLIRKGLVKALLKTEVFSLLNYSSINYTAYLGNLCEILVEMYVLVEISELTLGNFLNFDTVGNI